MIRSGKELQSATRAFIEKSPRESWWYVGSTLVLLTASLILAGLAPWWPIRLSSSVCGGLIMARAFILYHDFIPTARGDGGDPGTSASDSNHLASARHSGLPPSEPWDEETSQMVSYREAATCASANNRC